MGRKAGSDIDTKDKNRPDRGQIGGQGVRKEPDGEAEREAARAADRAPLDARTGRPMANPDEGRLERPDTGTRADDPSRDQLADSADRQPHDRSS
jgi:hypothetical protein